VTEDSLHQALLQGAASIKDFFQGMEEPQRRALAPYVLALYRKWDKAGYGETVEGFSWDKLSAGLPYALLATASMTELKAVRCWYHGLEHALAILENRRPRWLADWAADMLERNPRSWSLVRLLCRQGLIARPEGEAYILGMITGPSRGAALDILQEDPNLLEELENLFQIEGRGEFSLAAYDKYVSIQSSWSYALQELSGRGQIERALLLRWSLEALRRDFETFRAGWFSRFHESLQPNLKERCTLLSFYLPLLGSRVRPTVSFALKALQIIAKAGQLPAEDYGREVTPVLTSPDKGTALTALKLLLSLAPPQLTEHLAQSLTHPHPEVQETALKALEKGEKQPRAEDWAHLGEGLAASLHGRWAQWLGSAPPTPSPMPAPELVPESDRVEPCADLGELVQLVAQLLEDPRPAWQVERCLDGLVRFGCSPQSRLTEPLLKRAKSLIQKHQRNRSPFQEQTPPLQVALAELTRHWLEPSQSPTFGKQHFLQERLLEVSQMLDQGGGFGLLALPDKKSGWISEATLQSRLQSTQKVWPRDQEAARQRLPGAARPVPNYRVETTVHDKFTHRNLRVDWGAAARFPESCLGQSPLEDAGWLSWLSCFWPAGREFWATRGLETIANNLDWWEARWNDRIYLENLLEDQPLGPRAALLLAFGLGCKQAEQVGLAVDATLLGLRRQHLQADGLGAALVEAAHSQMIKPARWAKSLGQVGQVQPAAVLCALEKLLVSAPSDFDLGPLLPGLWELCHQLSQPLSDSARSRLANFPGQGASGRLARKLSAANRLEQIG
jgi:hypothetical protein